jgi:Zn-dependent protease
MKIGLIDLVQFLVGYSFFLLSASVHESAHAWTAFKFGDPTAKLQNRISLNPANHIDLLGTVIIPFMVFLSGIPIIGWAKPTPVNQANFSNPRRDGMYVSGAGPVSNLLVVAVLAILWHISFFFLNTVGYVALLFCYVFGTGILINLSLAVFNMMPIHPLDGSGVLEGFIRKDASLLFYCSAFSFLYSHFPKRYLERCRLVICSFRYSVFPAQGYMGLDNGINASDC